MRGYFSRICFNFTCSSLCIIFSCLHHSEATFSGHKPLSLGLPSYTSFVTPRKGRVQCSLLCVQGCANEFCNKLWKAGGACVPKNEQLFTWSATCTGPLNTRYASFEHICCRFAQASAEVSAHAAIAPSGQNCLHKWGRMAESWLKEREQGSLHLPTERGLTVVMRPPTRSLVIWSSWTVLMRCGLYSSELRRISRT